jgi:BarA-like signal transduction histidine kinase
MIYKKMDSNNNANAMVLQQNGLRYVMPKPLSTSLVRTFKKQYAQRQTYGPAETIVFDLNVSGQVDPEVSYLTFKLSSDQDFQFGKGSAGNIIREIRIQSKNGVELDRIQNYNAWNYIRLNTMEDGDELNFKGPILGHSQGPIPAAGFQFVIPCSHLSGLFRPHVKGQKIPSHMLSGARIEITLENVGRALQRNATDNTTYTVEKPTFNLMEHTLNDNTLKVLTEESANNGLEYVYDRVFCSIETTNNNTLHTQIKKAVSQATCVITSIHDVSKQSDVKQDSFETLAPGGGVFEKYQYRIASNYFPQIAVDNISDAYMISESCHSATRVKGWNTNNGFANYTTDTFAVAHALKSDHEISSSGLAINNSATLALEYESSDGSNKIYYTFLVYTALARCFLQQVTVKV